MTTFMLLLILLLIAGCIVSSRLPSWVKLLVVMGLALRIVGAFARYEIMMDFYNGFGDSLKYYETGLALAEMIRNFDFSLIVNHFTTYESWWGTAFVEFVSGLVLGVIGSSLMGEYIVFSMFTFVGLMYFSVAFKHAYPHFSVAPYLAWICLFPSLWYWPSSIGKEALILMGLGLAVAGFVGRGDRIRWALFGTGLFLVAAVRPQVAAIVLFSVILAQWLSFGGGWNLQRAVQGILILGIGLAGIWYLSQSLGIEEFDIEGIESYVASNPARSATGSTNVETVSLGWKGIPLAMVNVLFRPFPWEVTNMMVLLSSLEVVGLWAIVFWRRRNLLHALRHWKSDRLVRFSLIFVLVYAIAFGMLVINLGVIARQRVLLFPLLFILVEAVPYAARARIRRRSRVPRSPHFRERYALDSSK